MMDNTQKNRAFVWYQRHSTYVDAIRKKNNGSIEPSSEDKRDPSLWKAIHWNWFFTEIWTT